MDYVIASYEVVPLLAEYSPRINAQQLKNALDLARRARPGGEADRRTRQTFRPEPELGNGARGRHAAASNGRRWRRASCVTFMRYHRDLRRLEALNSATGQRQSDRQLEDAGTLGHERHAVRVPVAGRAEAVRRQSSAPRDSESRYPGLVAADPLAAGTGHESGVLLQSEFLRPGQQAAGQVRRAQSICRRRRHHRRAAGARRRGSAGGQPGLRAGAGDHRHRARLQPSAGARRTAVAGTGNRNFVSGFGAHVPDGWRTADHDFRRAERERPPVVLQQTGAQGHRRSGEPVQCLCLSDASKTPTPARVRKTSS